MAKKQKPRTETAEARAKRIAQLNKPKKGDPSPNPAGKPKGTLNRSTIIQKFLLAKAPGKSEKFGIKEGELTYADAIILKQIDKALAGDPHAYDRVMDGGLGKVPEKVDINTKPADAEPDFSTPEAASRAFEDALKNAKK